MNKLAMTVFFVFALGHLAFAGNPIIGAVDYTPAPAIPGEYLNLFVHVTNNSSSDAANVLLKVDFDMNNTGSNFPFSLDSDSAAKDVGTIKANQSAIARYKIRVDPRALDGTYTINLQVGENSRIERSQPFDMQVIGRRPVLSIAGAGPSDVVVGKTTLLELEIKNTGSKAAHNISAGISEDRTVTSGGIVVEREIIPMGAALSGISGIEQGSSAKVQIPIIINPGAGEKAYFIPVKIDFYDDNKTKYTDTQYIGVKVTSPAQVGVSLVDAKPDLVPGQKSAVTVEIYNTGIGTAKYMTAKATSDVGTIKQGEYFIGSLDSDDSDTIKLDVSAGRDLQPGKHYIDLEIKYKDGFGEEYAVQKRLDAVVYSPSEVPKQDSGFPIVPVVLVLIVLGAGYWFFVRKKSK